ncbi:hypothetical protein BaRGS_00039570, partial [Batillaria attramentaria]
ISFSLSLQIGFVHSLLCELRQEQSRPHVHLQPHSLSNPPLQLMSAPVIDATTFPASMSSMDGLGQQQPCSATTFTVIRLLKRLWSMLVWSQQQCSAIQSASLLQSLKLQVHNLLAEA